MAAGSIIEMGIVGALTCRKSIVPGEAALVALTRLMT